MTTRMIEFLLLPILVIATLESAIPAFASGKLAITEIRDASGMGAQGAIGSAAYISGSGFGSSQGASSVTFNGTLVPQSNIQSWTSSQINLLVPAGATTGNVIVTVSGKSSNGVIFTIVPTPTITSLYPTSAGIGTWLTIYGTNFGSARDIESDVTINGVVAQIQSWSDTSIAVAVPLTSSGNVQIFQSGVETNAAPLTIFPYISSMSPHWGPAGTAVTLSGVGFGTTQGNSTVSFNGALATVDPSNWSATSIATTVPSGATTGNSCGYSKRKREYWTRVVRGWLPNSISLSSP